jgi:hypothetical protein
MKTCLKPKTAVVSIGTKIEAEFGEAKADLFGLKL